MNLKEELLKNEGWQIRIELSLRICGIWFSGFPQLRALASCTSIFSVANHSTPFVKPKAPLL
jgi:hypothetical protein